MTDDRWTKVIHVLRKEMPRTGQWLFRHRSVVPVVVLPLFAFSMWMNASTFAGLPWLDRYWAFVCMGLAYVGFLVRTVTVGYAPAGTSGRATRKQQAHSLNTTGMYSLARNPLYFANLVITIGVVMTARSWELVAVVVLLFFLYYERIIAAEEAFLEDKFGDAFRTWASSTPCFFPRPWGWRPNATRFSLRKAIRSEFYSFTTIAGWVSAAERGRIALLEWRLTFEPVWDVIIASAALLWVLLWMLKKCTRVLAPR